MSAKIDQVTFAFINLFTLILRSRSYGDDMIVNTRAVRRLIVVLSGFTDVSEISRLLL